MLPEVRLDESLQPNESQHPTCFPLWRTWKISLALVVGCLLVVSVVTYERSLHQNHPSAESLAESTKPKWSEYIIFNANIYSMTDADPGEIPVQAMAVSNGNILEVSNDAIGMISRYGFPSMDARGATILPGFGDSHTHLLNEGLVLVQVDLFEATSPEECVERIRRYVLENDVQPGEWIVGRRFNQNLFPGSEWPTKEPLDADFPNNPIYLSRLSGAGWVNSAAMALADIPDEDPDGGEILRDEYGEPTGIFIGNANSIMSSIVPPPSREEHREALRHAAQTLNTFGITSAHYAGTNDNEIGILKEMIDDEDLHLRIYAMIRENRYGSAMLEKYCASSNPEPPVIDYGGQLTMHSIKISLDGVLGSRSALFFDDYSDEPGYKGDFWFDEDEFKQLIPVWAKCGYQINTHAIGDRANTIVLDMYERMFTEHPEYQDLRFRVEHAQFVTPEDVSRFGELKVIPSIQPTHTTNEIDWAPLRVGYERMEHGYLLESFIKTGALVALGSDLPESEVNPLLGIYAAISRQRPDGTPDGGWYPKERISLHDAVRGFTYNPAFAAHWETQIGTLEAGKRADFVMLDRNIMTETLIDVRAILEANVIATIFDGACVYYNDGIEIPICI